MKLKKIFLVIFGFLTSLFLVDDFKRFLNDNSGGLILPFGYGAYNDEEWIEYRRLKINHSVKSIDPDDLPDDFCEEACRLVDEFHRKTVNEGVEWMLYFDYTTGEVIYCWKGGKGKIDGDFNRMDLEGKHITSIHSHTKRLYSFPSPDNFDILGNEFEDYEIITSLNAFWIVEFKGFIDKTTRKRFQQDIGEDMSSTILTIRILCNPYSVNDITEEVLGNYLMNELDKEIQDINLILVKKEYDQMGNEKNRDDNWVHISKCGGIPMYPNEYHFEMEDPVEVTEEHVKSRKIRLAKFLEKYGLELVDEEYGCIGKDQMSAESNIVHISRCGGIPMYPTESIIKEMKDTLDDEQFEIYKRRVEKVWKKLGAELPWDE